MENFSYTRTRHLSLTAVSVLFGFYKRSPHSNDSKYFEQDPKNLASKANNNNNKTRQIKVYNPISQLKLLSKCPEHVRNAGINYDHGHGT